jgi:hypothetical protein
MSLTATSFDLPNGVIAMMKRFAAAVLLLALSCFGASAQSCFTDPAGTRTNCGSPVMYINGSLQSIAVDATHGLPVNIVAGAGGGLSVAFAGPIGANGTPVGFADASGNFQPLIGNTAAFGPYVDTKIGSNLANILTASATPVTPIAATASDNHATLVNGAHVAVSVHTSNNSATKNYLRLYDAGTGFNGCNSATGVIFAMEIPPNDSGFSVSLGGSNGIAVTNGLSWCITSGFGLTDTTNATASAIYANASYR